MNAQIDWPVLLATTVVWIALFWWTVRTATSTSLGLLLKSVILLLLVAVAGFMLWNIYIFITHRRL